MAERHRRAMKVAPKLDIVKSIPLLMAVWEEINAVKIRLL